MQLPSVFTPNLAYVLDISHLFSTVLWVMGAILLLVTSLVLYISWRYRSRGGTEEPPQVFGSRKLEIAWTVAPILLLIFIFDLTVDTMSTVDPSAAGHEPDLKVIGHQWWWEVQYVKSGAVTANTIL